MDSHEQGSTATATGRFHDRAEAGRLLAERLREYAGRDDVIVLALPRGGVPVGYEIAESLGAPLDVFVVRKLGVPGHEELAMGAIASGGGRVVNTRLVEALGIPAERVEAVEAQERSELARRERDYRGERQPPGLAGRTVILVDDGLATGATMFAAVRAVRQEHPARVVVAVPVARQDVCAALRREADAVVCVATPEDFRSVGTWYDDFSQTQDDDVRELLWRSRQPATATRHDAIRELTGTATDYDPLVERAAATRVFLIGEASHGTHEFYRARADLTKRLIAEAGYTAVAVEADWPDAYRVNCFVRGAGDDAGPEEALGDFRRFPAWMWRNRDVAEFVGWLREWNDALPEGAPKVGFYGLDLYSLHTSMEAVVEFLEQVDPQAARRARERYACFDHFSRDAQLYGYQAGLGTAEPCERQAVEQLVELQRRRAELAGAEDRVREDRFFYAEQNARLVVNAEQYYRAAFLGGVESWNLRDMHMADTLDALVAHLARTRGSTRAVVWEHNSHIGDARATEPGEAGELNLGQLVRERYGRQAHLVGFTTFTGTVTAASDWGGPAERKRVRPALSGSWEQRFHERGVPRFLLDPEGLGGRRLERAIGVIYRPELERRSHYFHARLAEQFDAVIHIDETHALEPLERTSQWEAGELPETFPSGV